MAHTASKQVENLPTRAVKPRKRWISQLGDGLVEWAAVIIITPALVYGVLSLQDLPV